jgi:hypothetical protein
MTNTIFFVGGFSVYWTVGRKRTYTSKAKHSPINLSSEYHLMRPDLFLVRSFGEQDNSQFGGEDPHDPGYQPSSQAIVEPTPEVLSALPKPS